MKALSRSLVMGLVVGSAASAFATNASIKNANSDLAVKSNWSNWDQMVSTGGGALINASGHYTLSADIEVNGFIAISCCESDCQRANIIWCELTVNPVLDTDSN